MEKILDIIEAIAHEKNISRENAIEAFKDALINTAKRLTTPSSDFEVIIDNDTKTYSVNKVITVVPDGDERLEEEPDSYISLSEAKEFDDSIEVGDQLKEEFVLEDYGRTASANLFRELEYHVQRRIEQDLFEKYREKVGTVMLGTVNRIDNEDNTHVEIGELKGIMSRRNRIKGETFKRGDTIRALLRYVSVDPQYGLFLELTRTSPKFLEALMANEVPEIADGVVEIVAASRIPGERAKIALKTDQMNVDPIGAAVGVKGFVSTQSVKSLTVKILTVLNTHLSLRFLSQEHSLRRSHRTSRWMQKPRKPLLTLPVTRKPKRSERAVSTSASPLC